MSIFLSHTHADKPLVEPFALKLAEVFGQDAVFYDSWSIQPGDGVIGKMDAGLSECRHFFFFVSNKSLQSKMVALEWQNALAKATKGDCKFIPVRIDNVPMPTILLQTLYIDAFTNGFETALRQIVDVANGSSTFRALGDGSFQNIRAYLSGDERTRTIEFRAEAYMEPHSRFLVLLTNAKAEVRWSAPGEGMFESGFNEGGAQVAGTPVNALLMARNAATTPGFPFVVELAATQSEPVTIVGAMRLVARNQWAAVPMYVATGA